MTFCYNLQLKRVRGRFAYTIYGHSLIRLKGPRVPEYCHKIRLPSTSTKSIATRVSTPLLRIHCFLEQRKESFSFLPVRQYERSNMERLRQAWELNNNGVQLVMSGDNKNGIVSFKNALSLMKDVTVLEKDQHAFDSGEAPSFSTFFIRSTILINWLTFKKSPALFTISPFYFKSATRMTSSLMVCRCHFTAPHFCST
jgi:hypothetical protein